MKLSKIKEFMGNHKKYVIIGVVSLLVLVIGVSYAIFIDTKNNTTNQIIEAGDLVVIFDKSNQITADLQPKTEDAALLDEGYTFTIKNTGSLPASYKIYVYNNPSGDTANYLDHSNLKVSMNGEAGALLSSKTQADGKYVVAEGSIVSGATKDQVIRVWLKSDVDASVIGKKVNLILDVEAIVYEDPCNGSDKLNCRILAQGGGAAAIEAKPEVLNQAVTAETSGLYAADDDYGVSYYYRGVKRSLNNNVIFAGYQWKILRINGDGSIRLIYHSDCPGNSCSTDFVGQLMEINGNTIFAWNTTNDDDAKYVGYMYGGANGSASTNLNEATTNTTSSNAKVQLDKWYQTKLSAYSNYLSDNIFCNDRSISSGEGYGTSVTYYGSYERIYQNRANPTPTFKCPQRNDAFTVSDTSKGNGALTYPIGLITADEFEYAGSSYFYYNSDAYLSINDNYWSMSPNNFGGMNAYMWDLRNGGLNAEIVNNDGNGFIDLGVGLKAVINLKSDSIVTSGDGSSATPFKIE